MSKVQTLRVFVKQRLTAAAEEIFELFERTIAEYEEELGRHRKLLDAVFKPQVQLHRADVQQLSVSKEDILPEQLRRPEEDDITKFKFTPVPVKSEAGEEKPQSSKLHQRQTVFGIRDVERWTTEAAGADCGGLEPAPNFNLQAATCDETPHFSEPDTDDSSDWEETREPQPGSNPRYYTEAPVSDMEYNTVKTPGSSERVTNSDHKEHLQKLDRVQTGVKPLSCSVCGKRYRRTKFLMKHMRLHAGRKTFSCSVCKETFQEGGHFVRHMRTHKEEKRFSCSVCGRSFGQLPTLTRHSMVHTGEKPFSCTVCDKRFTRRYVFRKHKCNGGS
ncbi:uncharacterized protein [Pagrus major]|uniref:uncharacterized protein n=1 Tax=Pagrus major TaxID=143350 RepID=UPI003CC8D2CA